MKSLFYDFESADNLSFYFESVSNQKSIVKVVAYTPIFKDADIYFLGFGDVGEDGTIDDLVVSNNQDFAKILATVIQTILTFFETYPQYKVFFEGSTKSRTRLYQIIINRELENISKKFVVQGLTEFGFENYQKNRSYDGFLIQLKN